MQQTAPKFMAQVKARFVAPNTTSTQQSNHAQSSPKTQQPQNRPQRVTSGNFGHVNKQVQGVQQNSGALSHRQMQIEPMHMNNTKIEAGGQTSSTSATQKHHISLQKLMQSDQAKKRELSGLQKNAGNNGVNNAATASMFVNQAASQGYEGSIKSPQSQQLHQNNQMKWQLPQQSAEPHFNAPHQSSGHQQTLDLNQQQQYALSQQNALLLFNHQNLMHQQQQNQPQYHSQSQYQMQQQVFQQQPNTSPIMPQGNVINVAENGGHSNLALQAANMPLSSSQQIQSHPRSSAQQNNLLPFGYNNMGEQDNNQLLQLQQQRLQANAQESNHNATGGMSRHHQQFASVAGAPAEQSHTQEHQRLVAVEMISGVQLATGKRLPNFQINKQMQQQKVTNNMAVSEQLQHTNNKSNSNQGNQLHPVRQSHNVQSGDPNNRVGGSSTPVMGQSQQSIGKIHHAQTLTQGDAGQPGVATTNSSMSQQKPAAQISANLNMMKQLYAAKGGVQTPPANFKGSSSSVGSRRQSGESSGMMSMGSIGTNFNEGNDVVQKPLVREFKTQGRLNRGIMPGENSQEDPAMTHNLLSRKAGQAVQNFAKKASPKGSTLHRPRQVQKRTANGNANQASKDTHITPVVQISTNNLNQQNATVNQQNVQSGRHSNTKKFKSVSESNASGSGLKSYKLKGMIKRDNPHPSFAATAHPDNHQSIFDNQNRGEEAEDNFKQPEQPQEDFSPPDLNFKSQTLPMHNSEGEHPHEQVSNISPNKQSFQHSSNQDVIERNEELMSLLACLNEQAIKELNQQDETEWETGMQRLLKAYKIMVETKNPNSFDANYKAIICYNLACCCQMQSELQDCSKYLTKAIEFVSIKLDSLKEQAISQFNANSNQLIQSSSLEQPSLTITNTSITTTTIVQKNSDLFDQRKQIRGSNNVAGKNTSTTPISTRNAQGQLTAVRGNRYTATGKASTNYGSNSQQQNSRNLHPGAQTNQRGSQQTRPAKSPMRVPTTAEKQRATPAGGRPLASAATTNSLFSEFSRFANANSKQKVSQQSLRTISVNNNANQVSGKVRGIGASSTKNAQSQAQFSKPGLFNAGATPTARTGKQASNQQNNNIISSQRKREAQNNYNFSATQGQAETKKNAGREAKKTKALKVPQIRLENWLECYNKATNRPPREILERSIHLTRYHCRFVLQLCAVLSQLNEHEQALCFSKKASGLATQLTEMTLILIKDETKPAKTNQDNSVIGEMSTQKPKRRKHSTSNQLDPYNTSLSKQKTTVSARFANQGTKGHNSQNSSLVQSNLNQLSKDKVSQSYTMSNFHALGGKEQQSSQALNNSGMALSYFPNPEQIKNERESLERIHTFSLKEPIDFNGSDDQIGAQTLTGNFLDPLFGSNTDRALRGNEGEKDKHNLSMEAPFSGNRQRGISEGSRNSSTASNRSCSQYIPEKVKIFQKQIFKTHDIVEELIGIQKEFCKISEWNFKERRDYFQDRMAEKKKLKISFQTFEEMNKLQIEQKFKITARSALGVKNYGTDDWIFSFNIGNIMHLQTLGFDELANAKTTQSMMKGADTKQNNGLLKAGIQGSVTTQQGIRNYLMSEISKDQLLYKALYVIVSYFCIGTELRFLATLTPQKYSLKDSEIWHAKAIHIASYFLPNDCPLIQHITQSYAKHHLRPKIKRRQDQLAILANQ